jgi:hypothetical protein
VAPPPPSQAGGQVVHPVVLAPAGGDEGAQPVAGRLQERDTGILRPVEPFGDQPFGFVPAPGEEAVDGELEDRVDGRRQRTPVAGGGHDEFQGGPACRQAAWWWSRRSATTPSAGVAGRHGDAGDVERVGNRSESGDRLVQGAGRGRTGPGRVAQQPRL